MKFPPFLVLMLIQFPLFNYSQVGIVTTGEDFDNGNGSISFSMGLVAINYFESESLTISEGIHHTYEIMPNEDNNSSFEALVYPNPTVDLIYLEFNEVDITGLIYQIVDMSGRILISETIESPELSISMEAYAEGTYILNVIKFKNHLAGFKIIKN